MPLHPEIDQSSCKMNDIQIGALHTRLNFPGVDATFLAAKKWAREQNPPVAPPTKARVAEVIKRRTTKQVFTKVRTSGGHQASPGFGLYQHDLVSMEAVQGSRNKDFKFIYLLISVSSRKLYARKLKGKEPPEVRDAPQCIIAGGPAAARPPSRRACARWPSAGTRTGARPKRSCACTTSERGWARPRTSRRPAAATAAPVARGMHQLLLHLLRRCRSL